MFQRVESARRVSDVIAKAEAFTSAQMKNGTNSGHQKIGKFPTFLPQFCDVTTSSFILCISCHENFSLRNRISSKFEGKVSLIHSKTTST